MLTYPADRHHFSGHYGFYTETGLLVPVKTKQFTVDLYLSFQAFYSRVFPVSESRYKVFLHIPTICPWWTLQLEMLHVGASHGEWRTVRHATFCFRHHELPKAKSHSAGTLRNSNRRFLNYSRNIKKVSTEYAETIGWKPSAYSLIVIRCRILTPQI